MTEKNLPTHDSNPSRSISPSNSNNSREQERLIIIFPRFPRKQNQVLVQYLIRRDRSSDRA